MRKTDRSQSNVYQPSERGQSLVELTLTFMILLVLLGGVLDLGRALFTFVALRDAAQEGAVYGSIQPDMAAYATA
jgi:Flp pilus assembly protein TadG